MMNRAQLLETIGLMAGLSPDAASANRERGDSQPPTLNDFWYVVRVRSFNVGLLAAGGTVLIARRGSSGATPLNLPRPTRGKEGWQIAAAPRMPIVNPEARHVDVVMGASPDYVTAVGTVGPYAIFAMMPPSNISPRCYLVLLAPSTQGLQTMWLPQGFDDYAIALYGKADKPYSDDPSWKENLYAVDRGGNQIRIDLPDWTLPAPAA
jgi:hypothetical protein